MAVLPIRIYGDPVLRQKAKPVEHITDEIRQLVHNLGETMFDAPGIGLAAPQVGALVRLFVIDPHLGEDENRTGEFVAFIDPVLSDPSDEEVLIEEGCLSIPDIRADVERSKTQVIEFTDLGGERHRMTVDGMVGRVIQHEYDHLDGIMFVDRISTVRRRLLGKQLKQMARSQKRARTAA
jgi:peptide deformylase